MRIQHTTIALILTLVLALSSLGVADTASADNTNMAAFTTVWHDPPGATVHSVRNAVHVEYSGSTVTYVECRDHRWWLTETGWHEDAHNLYCSQTASYGDSQTYQKYRNPYFCATIDTYSYYSLNHAYGTPYGVSGWIDNTWSEGGCANWLWFDSYFEPGVYY